MSYLSHHGILGMKHGVRNGPPYPLNNTGRARQNLSRSNQRNIDSWGKSKETNTLYIIGYSGSGKSATASVIGKNDEVIHLDTILEKENHKAEGYNYSFEKFCKSNGLDYSNYFNPKLKREDKWKILDDIGDRIDDYGKSLYPKKRLVVEGVQLGDDTLYPNKSFSMINRL